MMIDLVDHALVQHIIHRQWTGAAIRVCHKTEVLWIQRADDETWTFPGGGRRSGDRHAWDTALRELAEETDIMPSSGYTKSQIWGVSKRKFVIFDLHLPKKPRVLLEKERFLGYQWLHYGMVALPTFEPLEVFFG